MKLKLNQYRQLMNAQAKRLGVCTNCFSNPAELDKGLVQCKNCIKVNLAKRRKRERNKLKKVNERS